MSSIYRYHNTIGRASLDLTNSSGESASTDLCTIGGWRYVSINDDAIPDPDVALEEAPLTVELRSAIKAASPHCKLIKKRAWRIIDKKYPPEDREALSIKMGAAGASIITLSDAEKAILAEYQQTLEGANSWAAEQYTALGL